jgi:hypothetical protein
MAGSKEFESLGSCFEGLERPTKTRTKVWRPLELLARPDSGENISVSGNKSKLGWKSKHFVEFFVKSIFFNKLERNES